MFKRLFSFLSPAHPRTDLPGSSAHDAELIDAGDSNVKEKRWVSEYTPRQELSGLILKVSPGGIVVTLPNRETGLVLRDEISWPGYPRQFKKGDSVDVVVTSFNPERGLYLSIRRARSEERVKAVYERIKVGEVIDGRIKSIKPYGVFVTVGPGVSGLCHVSSLNDIAQYDKKSIGQDIKVRVIGLNPLAHRIELEPVCTN